VNHRRRVDDDGRDTGNIERHREEVRGQPLAACENEIEKARTDRACVAQLGGDRLELVEGVDDTRRCR
jgi:hypothetical protein